MSEAKTSLLITGAGGYVGRELLRRLSADPGAFERIVALDVRAAPQALPNIDYRIADVREPALRAIVGEVRPETVVHLAGIVNPGKQIPRDVAYSVDVLGTENVLAACVEHEVRHLIVTSSGAAYGYHADNPSVISEDAPLRGNEEFAYAYHKRLVEELLARYREEHPELGQLILRIATVMGERTDNQITALFEKPIVLGVRGTPSPWVFVWDQDVVECILKGAREQHAGIYNVCGDGTLSMPEIAAVLNKRFIKVPAGLIAAVLRVMKALRATQYGPEQVNFLRYRPVLSNEHIKSTWYRPQQTTREAFESYLAHRQRRGAD